VGEHGMVVAFTCNHCPYVVASESRIEAIASRCRETGIGFVGINANDPDNYPEDGWDAMVMRASSMSYPYLHDVDQSVAHAYGAERTPEFYLIDAGGFVVYRGRLDDAPRNPAMATSHDLANAIDSMLGGSDPKPSRTDAIGCSVKWK